MLFYNINPVDGLPNKFRIVDVRDNIIGEIHIEYRDINIEIYDSLTIDDYILLLEIIKTKIVTAPQAKINIVRKVVVIR